MIELLRVDKLICSRTKVQFMHGLHQAKKDPRILLPTECSIACRVAIWYCVGSTRGLSMIANEA